MSRSITTAAKKEIYASETGAVFLTVLQVIHSSITTLYFVNNMVDVVYDGVTYTAYPFKFDPPKDKEGAKPESKITFPNIDRELLAIVRSVSDPITIKAALIMILPDNTASKEGGWWQFEMKNVSYDMMTITGDLEYDINLDNYLSKTKYNNLTFPGLYG